MFQKSLFCAHIEVQILVSAVQSSAKLALDCPAYCGDYSFISQVSIFCDNVSAAPSTRELSSQPVALKCMVDYTRLKPHKDVSICT